MTKPKINLALQGGGAHGAFTWGVLDRLLEGGEVEIAGISGTSAGALNGAAVKAGLVREGAEAARANLDWMWDRIGHLSSLHVPAWMEMFLPSTPYLSQSIEYSPGYAFSDWLSRATSPYGLGPFYQNPLAPIVRELRYNEVCAAQGPDFFVCATNVRSGKIRIFEGDDITPDALLASACLPTLFQAVEIPDADGNLQAYWDGGYSGNPALFPLYPMHLPDDVVIVNINPLRRETLPYYPQEILNRINEVSFNASLLAELRSIAFVHRMLADGTIEPGTKKRVLVHMISDDALMSNLSVATKTVPQPIIVARLKAAGRAAAERFLDDHLDKVGKTSSVKLEELYG
ncbi:patatin-like phospholipase family protein [Maribius pontilimi]|uniref:Patatin-like phospholipase family protein n=1 Tax=Palleronia pontilimi TaxID=1964209 RepID=A0A934MCX4_9RHOB|nr:patatin-like phospholipase family protein [Palleronia pontilimi]MBJ3762960.1 patatin-like phospholipase family protein [Palleronia pontilimi]